MNNSKLILCIFYTIEFTFATYFNKKIGFLLGSFQYSVIGIEILFDFSIQSACVNCVNFP